MSRRKAHGQVRRAQVITTYGPGALIDLPKHSAIVGGLDTWPRTSDLEEIMGAQARAEAPDHDRSRGAWALLAAS